MISTLALLAMASAAQAQQGAFQDPNDPGRWHCRGSAVRIHPATLERIEPAVANGNPFNANPDHDVCVSDSATITGQTGQIQVLTGLAVTAAIPPNAPARIQTIGATGRVENLEIGGPNGIKLDVAQADASTSCTGPTTIKSTVGNLSIGGQVIPLDPVADAVKTITTPLGAVIRVEVNRTIFDASPGNFDATRRALEITVLEGASPFGAAKVIVGEAKIGIHNNPCLPDAGTPVPPTNNGQCPDGFVVDPLGGGQCVKVIIGNTGPCTLPFFEFNGVCIALPREIGGGFLVPLSAISGPCRTAKLDTQVAIIGTNGNDRITGTNKDDRILTFAGRDRVDGGRGNDCEDGGTQNDVLDGANDNDLLYGMPGRDVANGGSGKDLLSGGTGKDKLSGGSGNDKLDGGKDKDRIFGDAGNDFAKGGAGRDYMNTGNGRDKVFGGPGFDVINAATAGPPATINCGSGGGSARISPNELKRVRNCKPVRLDRRLRGITGPGKGV